MCIENESTGKYTCSHAPYTRFTSVYIMFDLSCSQFQSYMVR